jgi:hypothetical protein
MAILITKRIGQISKYYSTRREFAKYTGNELNRGLNRISIGVSGLVIRGVVIFRKPKGRPGVCKRGGY